MCIRKFASIFQTQEFFISISMAPLPSFSLLILISLLPFSSATSRHNSRSPSPSPAPHPVDPSSNLVNQNATVLQSIQSALSETTKNLGKGGVMVQDILKNSAGNVNRTKAANTCLQLVQYAEHRIDLVGGALTRGSIKDARAWMSAALVYQYDCWSALKYVNDTSQVVETMSFFNSTLIAGSSSTLAMLVNYDIYGDKTGSWGPIKTERDGFWEPVSSSSGSVGGGVPAGLKPDVTVCKGGDGCDYKTVQEAVDAAKPVPGKRFVIWIKAGVYEETVRVPLEKTNVVFLGDGIGKTVITGSSNVGQVGMTTYNSATVGVLGDGFMASNLTIQNTAGPDAHQAVAFRSDSDLSIIENVEFIGNQDTLYAHSLRQYYKTCRIQGNVDFIFGNSAAFFDNCLILIAPRQQNPEKGEKNAITAHGRIDPGQSTGFIFQNSVINGTDEYLALFEKNPEVHKNFLGRPWKEYSRTVFIKCVLDGIVTVDGWMPWDGEFALKTLYYGEFENTGKGADTSKRIGWSSRIPAEHVDAYSVENFIQGDKWINK